MTDLARPLAEIELEMSEDDTSTFALMRLAEEGGAFDFWTEEGEDVYSAEDGDPV